MLKSIILPAAAALLLGAVAVAPAPASAHWASATAAANQENAQAASDVVQVQRRFRGHWRGGGWRGAHWRGGGWRRGFWLGAPFIAAAPFAYASPRCGWVWSPRRARNVWRCW
jgi:hypothetical protein